ncbi:unnamed protein product [Calypogeia fissa]
MRVWGALAPSVVLWGVACEREWGYHRTVGFGDLGSGFTRVALLGMPQVGLGAPIPFPECPLCGDCPTAPERIHYRGLAGVGPSALIEIDFSLLKKNCGPLTVARLTVAQVPLMPDRGWLWGGPKSCARLYPPPSEAATAQAYSGPMRLP